MTLPRNRLIRVEDTPYYHVVSRCVRRAFLCGFDSYSGKDYEHRRAWIDDKLFSLKAVFAIDVAAFAIMSNHFHLVLFIDTKQAEQWSQKEVLERWARLFALPTIARSFCSGQPLGDAQSFLLEELVERYRERLSSISWFMRLLNQSVARQANKEDNCTGKFFEGRFKSQALLDDAALLSCMAYVDLNPIRANMAQTPETSEYTSIQRRINAMIKQEQCYELLDFVPDNHQVTKGVIYRLEDYLELVDWTGRMIRSDKRGAIPANLVPILERLNVSEKEWLLHSQFFEQRFKRAAGQWHNLQRFAKRAGQQWLQGKPSILNTA